MKARLVALFAAVLLLVIPGVAMAATPAENLSGLTGHLDVAMAKVQAGDVAGSQAAYQAFAQGWPAIEDGVKAQSPSDYQGIESHMRDVQAAYSAQPADGQRILSALQALDISADQFISAQPAAGQPAASAPANGDMATVAGYLDQSQQRIAAGDAGGAATELKNFMQAWPGVEGQVSAKDQASYSRIEDEMAPAYGLLTSNPPRLQQASALIKDMQGRLAPFVSQPVHYGMFDAAIILLREGFEALLVFAALLAFLEKSGNKAKQVWIWAGGGTGLALSVVIAIVVNVAFAQAGGSSRELLEGVTGLVAAGMLVWMMFWLHGKANVQAWNRYISAASQRALATNSLLSLAAIAFLAVLREGAETVLFYVGIAPGIEPSQLFAGLAIGAGGLIAVAVLMLVVGVRIPIRPFFLGTSALVFFLAFKFAGMGVHSLQVSGVLSAHTPGWLPTSDFFGVFPTWETTIMQVIVVVVTALGFALTRDHSPSAAQSAARVAAH